MAEVIVTAAAEAEYLESLLWYAERSPSAAAGFVAEIDRALSAIGADQIDFRFARRDTEPC
jgi:hypothetical protein